MANGTKGQGGPAGSAPNSDRYPGYPGREFELAVWNAHRGMCARCQRVDVAKSASLALACLKGAHLLKANLSALYRHQKDEEEGVR